MRHPGPGADAGLQQSHHRDHSSLELTYLHDAASKTQMKPARSTILRILHTNNVKTGFESLITEHLVCVIVLRLFYGSQKVLLWDYIL